MILRQFFGVEKSGIIRGGSAEYSADTETGKIHYSGSVDVGFGFFTKKLSTSGIYEASPKRLLFETLDETGETGRIGNVELSVLSTSPAGPEVSIRILDRDISGVAQIFATTKESSHKIEKYLAIRKLTMKAAILGMVIEIILREV